MSGVEQYAAKVRAALAEVGPALYEALGPTAYSNMRCQLAKELVHSDGVQTVHATLPQRALSERCETVADAARSGWSLHGSRWRGRANGEQRIAAQLRTPAKHELRRDPQEGQALRRPISTR